jgi:hypothetical protein
VHTGGALVFDLPDCSEGRDWKWDISTPTQDGCLRCCAFYTDTIHRVEPVTSGVRAVLQFDILIDSNSDDDSYCRRDVDYLFHNSHYKEEWNMSGMEFGSPAETDAAVLEQIVSELLIEVTSVRSIAFSLFHLYRQQSILPEYLKGQDDLLYKTLSATFDLQLRPVVIDSRYNADDEPMYEYSIFPFIDSVIEKPLTCQVVEFVPTGSERVLCIYKDEYYTGNEARRTNGKYFASLIIVSLKKK